jgi:hypothetical protein
MQKSFPKMVNFFQTHPNPIFSRHQVKFLKDMRCTRKTNLAWRKAQHLLVERIAIKNLVDGSPD